MHGPSLLMVNTLTCIVVRLVLGSVSVVLKFNENFVRMNNFLRDWFTFEHKWTEIFRVAALSCRNPCAKASRHGLFFTLSNWTLWKWNEWKASPHRMRWTVDPDIPVAAASVPHISEFRYTECNSFSYRVGVCAIGDARCLPLLLWKLYVPENSDVSERIFKYLVCASRDIFPDKTKWQRVHFR